MMFPDEYIAYLLFLDDGNDTDVVTRPTIEVPPEIVPENITTMWEKFTSKTVPSIPCVTNIIRFQKPYWCVVIALTTCCAVIAFAIKRWKKRVGRIFPVPSDHCLFPPPIAMVDYQQGEPCPESHHSRSFPNAISFDAEDDTIASFPDMLMPGTLSESVGSDYLTVPEWDTQNNQAVSEVSEAINSSIQISYQNDLPKSGYSQSSLDTNSVSSKVSSVPPRPELINETQPWSGDSQDHNKNIIVLKRSLFSKTNSRLEIDSETSNYGRKDGLKSTTTSGSVRKTDAESKSEDVEEPFLPPPAANEKTSKTQNIRFSKPLSKPMNEAAYTHTENVGQSLKFYAKSGLKLLRGKEGCKKCPIDGKCILHRHQTYSSKPNVRCRFQTKIQAQSIGPRNGIDCGIKEMYAQNSSRKYRSRSEDNRQFPANKEGNLDKRSVGFRTQHGRGLKLRQNRSNMNGKFLKIEDRMMNGNVKQFSDKRAIKEQKSAMKARGAQGAIVSTDGQQQTRDTGPWATNKYKYLNATSKDLCNTFQNTKLYASLFEGNGRRELKESARKTRQTGSSLSVSAPSPLKMNKRRESSKRPHQIGQHIHGPVQFSIGESKNKHESLKILDKFPRRKNGPFPQCSRPMAYPPPDAPTHKNYTLPEKNHGVQFFRNCSNGLKGDRKELKQSTLMGNGYVKGCGEFTSKSYQLSKRGMKTLQAYLDEKEKSKPSKICSKSQKRKNDPLKRKKDTENPLSIFNAQQYSVKNADPASFSHLSVGCHFPHKDVTEKSKKHNSPPKITNKESNLRSIIGQFSPSKSMPRRSSCTSTEEHSFLIKSSDLETTLSSRARRGSANKDIHNPCKLRSLSCSLSSNKDIDKTYRSGTSVNHLSKKSIIKSSPSPLSFSSSQTKSTCGFMFQARQEDVRKTGSSTRKAKKKSDLVFKAEKVVLSFTDLVEKMSELSAKKKDPVQNLLKLSPKLRDSSSKEGWNNSLRAWSTKFISPETPKCISPKNTKGINKATKVSENKNVPQKNSKRKNKKKNIKNDIYRKDGITCIKSLSSGGVSGKKSIKSTSKITDACNRLVSEGHVTGDPEIQRMSKSLEKWSHFPIKSSNYSVYSSSSRLTKTKSDPSSFPTLNYEIRSQTSSKSRNSQGETKQKAARGNEIINEILANYMNEMKEQRNHSSRSDLKNESGDLKSIFIDPSKEFEYSHLNKITGKKETAIRVISPKTEKTIEYTKGNDMRRGLRSRDDLDGLVRVDNATTAQNMATRSGKRKEKNVMSRRDVVKDRRAALLKSETLESNDEPVSHISNIKDTQESRRQYLTKLSGQRTLSNKMRTALNAVRKETIASKNKMRPALAVKKNVSLTKDVNFKKGHSEATSISAAIAKDAQTDKKSSGVRRVDSKLYTGRRTSSNLNLDASKKCSSTVNSSCNKMGGGALSPNPDGSKNTTRRASQNSFVGKKAFRVMYHPDLLKTSSLESLSDGFAGDHQHKDNEDKLDTKFNGNGDCDLKPISMQENDISNATFSIKRDRQTLPMSLKEIHELEPGEIGDNDCDSLREIQMGKNETITTTNPVGVYRNKRLPFGQTKGIYEMENLSVCGRDVSKSDSRDHNLTQETVSFVENDNLESLSLVVKPQHGSATTVKNETLNQFLESEESSPFIWVDTVPHGTTDIDIGQELTIDGERASTNNKHKGQTTPPSDSSQPCRQLKGKSGVKDESGINESEDNPTKADEKENDPRDNKHQYDEQRVVKASPLLTRVSEKKAVTFHHRLLMRQSTLIERNNDSLSINDGTLGHNFENNKGFLLRTVNLKDLDYRTTFADEDQSLLENIKTTTLSENHVIKDRRMTTLQNCTSVLPSDSIESETYLVKEGDVSQAIDDETFICDFRDETVDVIDTIPIIRTVGKGQEGLTSKEKGIYQNVLNSQGKSRQDSSEHRRVDQRSEKQNTCLGNPRLPHNTFAAKRCPVTINVTENEKSFLERVDSRMGKDSRVHESGKKSPVRIDSHYEKRLRNAYASPSRKTNQHSTPEFQTPPERRPIQDAGHLSRGPSASPTKKAARISNTPPRNVTQKVTYSTSTSPMRSTKQDAIRVSSAPMRNTKPGVKLSVTTPPVKNTKQDAIRTDSASPKRAKQEVTRHISPSPMISANVTRSVTKSPMRSKNQGAIRTNSASPRSTKQEVTRSVTKSPMRSKNQGAIRTNRASPRSTKQEVTCSVTKSPMRSKNQGAIRTNSASPRSTKQEVTRSVAKSPRRSKNQGAIRTNSASPRSTKQEVTRSVTKSPMRSKKQGAIRTNSASPRSTNQEVTRSITKSPITKQSAIQTSSTSLRNTTLPIRGARPELTRTASTKNTKRDKLHSSSSSITRSPKQGAGRISNTSNRTYTQQDYSSLRRFSPKRNAKQAGQHSSISSPEGSKRRDTLNIRSASPVRSSNKAGLRTSNTSIKNSKRDIAHSIQYSPSKTNKGTSPLRSKKCAVTHSSNTSLLTSTKQSAGASRRSTKYEVTRSSSTSPVRSTKQVVSRMSNDSPTRTKSAATHSSGALPKQRIGQSHKRKYYNASRAKTTTRDTTSSSASPIRSKNEGTMCGSKASAGKGKKKGTRVSRNVSRERYTEQNATRTHNVLYRDRTKSESSRDSNASPVRSVKQSPQRSIRPYPRQKFKQEVLQVGNFSIASSTKQGASKTSKMSPKRSANQCASDNRSDSSLPNNKQAASRAIIRSTMGSSNVEQNSDRVEKSRDERARSRNRRLTQTLTSSNKIPPVDRDTFVIEIHSGMPDLSHGEWNLSGEQNTTSYEKGALGLDESIVTHEHTVSEIKSSLENSRKADRSFLSFRKTHGKATSTFPRGISVGMNNGTRGGRNAPKLNVSLDTESIHESSTTLSRNNGRRFVNTSRSVLQDTSISANSTNPIVFDKPDFKIPSYGHIRTCAARKYQNDCANGSKKCKDDSNLQNKNQELLKHQNRRDYHRTDEKLERGKESESTVNQTILDGVNSAGTDILALLFPSQDQREAEQKSFTENTQRSIPSIPVETPSRREAPENSGTYTKAHGSKEVKLIMNSVENTEVHLASVEAEATAQKGVTENSGTRSFITSSYHDVNPNIAGKPVKKTENNSWLKAYLLDSPPNNTAGDHTASNATREHPKASRANWREYPVRQSTTKSPCSSPRHHRKNESSLETGRDDVEQGAPEGNRITTYITDKRNDAYNSHTQSFPSDHRKTSAFQRENEVVIATHRKREPEACVVGPEDTAKTMYEREQTTEGERNVQHIFHSQPETNERAHNNALIKLDKTRNVKSNNKEKHNKTENYEDQPSIRSVTKSTSVDNKDHRLQARGKCDPLHNIKDNNHACASKRIDMDLKKSIPRQSYDKKCTEKMTKVLPPSIAQIVSDCAYEGDVDTEGNAEQIKTSDKMRGMKYEKVEKKIPDVSEKMTKTESDVLGVKKNGRGAGEGAHDLNKIPQPKRLAHSTFRPIKKPFDPQHGRRDREETADTSKRLDTDLESLLVSEIKSAAYATGRHRIKHFFGKNASRKRQRTLSQEPSLSRGQESQDHGLGISNLPHQNSWSCFRGQQKSNIIYTEDRINNKRQETRSPPRKKSQLNHRTFSEKQISSSTNSIKEDSRRSSHDNSKSQWKRFSSNAYKPQSTSIGNNAKMHLPELRKLNNNDTKFESFLKRKEENAFKSKTVCDPIQRSKETHQSLSTEVVPSDHKHDVAEEILKSSKCEKSSHCGDRNGKENTIGLSSRELFPRSGSHPVIHKLGESESSLLLLGVKDKPVRCRSDYSARCSSVQGVRVRQEYKILSDKFSQLSKLISFDNDKRITTTKSRVKIYNQDNESTFGNTGERPILTGTNAFALKVSKSLESDDRRMNCVDQERTLSTLQKLGSPPISTDKPRESKRANDTKWPQRIDGIASVPDQNFSELPTPGLPSSSLLRREIKFGRNSITEGEKAKTSSSKSVSDDTNIRFAFQRGIPSRAVVGYENSTGRNTTRIILRPDEAISTKSSLSEASSGLDLSWADSTLESNLTWLTDKLINENANHNDVTSGHEDEEDGEEGDDTKCSAISRYAINPCEYRVDHNNQNVDINSNMYSNYFEPVNGLPSFTKSYIGNDLGAFLAQDLNGFQKETFPAAKNNNQSHHEIRQGRPENVFNANSCHPQTCVSSRHSTPSRFQDSHKGKRRHNSPLLHFLNGRELSKYSPSCSGTGKKQMELETTAAPAVAQRGKLVDNCSHHQSSPHLLSWSERCDKARHHNTQFPLIKPIALHRHRHGHIEEDEEEDGEISRRRRYLAERGGTSTIYNDNSGDNYATLTDDNDNDDDEDVDDRIREDLAEGPSTSRDTREAESYTIRRATGIQQPPQQEAETEVENADSKSCDLDWYKPQAQPAISTSTHSLRVRAVPHGGRAAGESSHLGATHSRHHDNNPLGQFMLQRRPRPTPRLSKRNNNP